MKVKEKWFFSPAIPYISRNPIFEEISIPSVLRIYLRNFYALSPLPFAPSVLGPIAPIVLISMKEFDLGGRNTSNQIGHSPIQGHWNLNLICLVGHFSWPKECTLSLMEGMF